ncbi:CPBP family intramembrane metalloprotease [Priestia megaterium]|nr:CPBP family intramembrane metalloprotease [Priestia megaterium]
MKSRSFWQSFFTLFVLGLFGLFSIIPSINTIMEVQLKNVPNAPDLPPLILGVLSLINPLILLIIAIIIGNLLTPKLGLKSYIIQRVTEKKLFWSSIKPNISKGIGWGVVLAVIHYLLELTFQPWLPDSLKLTPESRNLVNTLGGVFYGGIVEEILVRWGLMSLLIWIGWRLFQQGKNQPKIWIIWFSILSTSLLFAIAHLGATVLLAPLTPIVLIRMIV